MNVMQIINAILVVGFGYLSIGSGIHSTNNGARSNKKQSDTVSFSHDISPIMKKYCLPCHTEDQMNPSELYLDSYDNMMAGGKHGKPIISGKADSSLLIMKLNPFPLFGHTMPLKRSTPFPSDTLKLIRQWIEQGAKNN
jgi:hypothetical protein